MLVGGGGGKCLRTGGGREERKVPIPLDKRSSFSRLSEAHEPRLSEQFLARKIAKIFGIFISPPPLFRFL